MGTYFLPYSKADEGFRDKMMGIMARDDHFLSPEEMDARRVFLESAASKAEKKAARAKEKDKHK